MGTLPRAAGITTDLAVSAGRMTRCSQPRSQVVPTRSSRKARRYKVVPSVPAYYAGLYTNSNPFLVIQHCWEQQNTENRMTAHQFAWESGGNKLWNTTKSPPTAWFIFGRSTGPSRPVVPDQGLDSDRQAL